MGMDDRNEDGKIDPLGENHYNWLYYLVPAGAGVVGGFQDQEARLRRRV